MTTAFISYAREDRVFVDALIGSLHVHGITSAWDQDHNVVPFSAPWRDEIEAGIRVSDKFIFVISPDSIASVPCGTELSSAQVLGKQIIPIVVRRPVDVAAVSPTLGDLNWIFFDDPRQFELAVSQLVTVLTTDLDWSKTHARLSVRAAEWAAAQRDKSSLLRGSELRAAEEWLTEAETHPQAPPTNDQRQYVAASRRGADRNSRRWRGALAAGLAVALALAVVAFIQRNDAQHQATVAEAHTLAAQASAALATDPAQALTLALASTKKSPSDAGTDVLRRALAADTGRIVLRPGGGDSQQATWSPSTQTIATSAAGGHIELWNARTGKVTATIGPVPGGQTITQLSYDPTGNYLAAVTNKGAVALFDARTGKSFNLTDVNGYITKNSDSVGGQLGQITTTWDPGSGRLFAYGALMTGLVSIDPQSGDIATNTSKYHVRLLAFAPTGSRALVTWSEFNVSDEIFDFNKNTSINVDALSDGVDYAGCWTSDGSQLGVWAPTEAQDLAVHIIDGNTATQLYSRIGNTTGAAACGINSDGNRYLATGDYQGEAALIQREDTQDELDGPVHTQFGVLSLRGHTQTINSVATSPDGAYVATGGDDGTVRVWDAADGRQVSYAGVPAGATGTAVNHVAFSNDGGLVLAVRSNGDVDIYDAGTGEAAVQLTTPAGLTSYAVGFVAGGSEVWGFAQQTVASTSSARVPPTVTALRVLVWDAATGAVRYDIALPRVPALGKPTCPIDLLSPVCSPSTAAAEMSGVAISGDGRTLAYVQPGAVVIRELASGTTHTLTLATQPTRIGFDSAGDKLLVVINDGLRIVAPSSANVVRIITTTSAPIDAVISADGSRVAAGLADGTAMVWDVASGTRFANYPRNKVNAGGQENPVVIHVALTANGKLLATGDSNGVILLRDTIDNRVIGTQTLVVNPLPDSPTYPVGQLTFANSDASLLAVNYPQPQAGDYQPPGAALLIDTSSGQVTGRLGSPSKSGAPYNPGLGISDDGQYVLTGVEGFAPPGQTQGPDAVYSVSGGNKLADLSNTVGRTPVYGYVEPNLTVSRAWSPDHTRLVTGATGVFACDACGSLKQLQATAAQRIAWRAAIGPTSTPPPGQPLD